MKLNKYLFVMSLSLLGGCNSESDDITITNNYIIEESTAIASGELAYIGEFELKTAVETDFFLLRESLIQESFITPIQIHFILIRMDI